MAPTTLSCGYAVIWKKYYNNQNKYKKNWKDVATDWIVFWMKTFAWDDHELKFLNPLHLDAVETNYEITTIFFTKLLRHFLITQSQALEDIKENLVY